MAQVCEATLKGPMFGGSRQHQRGSSGGVKGPWAFKAQRTLKKWNPNLRKVKAVVNGTPVIIKICMKAYKKMREEGRIWLKTREAFAYFRT